MPQDAEKSLGDVLIVSSRSNEHARVVSSKLEELGAGTEWLDPSASPPSILLATVPATLSTDDAARRRYRSAFIHHPLLPLFERVNNATLDDSLWLASWQNAIDWIADTYEIGAWFNDPRASRRSRSLAFQLQTAKLCKFTIPESCYTNDIAVVHELARRHKQIVVKAGNLPSPALLGKRILTTIVDPVDLSADVLQSSPCFFQQFVEKKYELRVHVVGDEILACKIESQTSAKTAVDWRNYDLANTPHFPVTLDPTLAEKCIKLSRRLGLNFAIIDLVVSKEGDFVFLEANSQGHWLWIEELTKLPITDTLVRHLSLPFLVGG